MRVQAVSPSHTVGWEGLGHLPERRGEWVQQPNGEPDEQRQWQGCGRDGVAGA